MKIVITGGGTGGHVSPALAVISEIQKQESNVEILYIGSYFGIENKIIFSQKDKSLRNEIPNTFIVQKEINFKRTLTGKYRRYFSFRNLLDPFLVLIGTFQALFYLIGFRPKVIFSKGGFVSLPTCLAGAILRIPIVLHESDAEMGLANRIIAPFARKIATAFPPSLFPEKLKRKITHVGNPQADFPKTSKSAATAHFGLSKNLKTILVAGGSQGAQKINNALKPNLVKLLQNYQVIHQTGTNNIKQFESFRKELPTNLKDRYRPFGFIAEDDLDIAFQSAGLTVIRAGAGLLFKSALFATPSIVVPLKGHQEANAEYFASKKAVAVIKNSDLNSQNLFEMILALLENEKSREKLSKNISVLASPCAAKDLAKLVLTQAK